MVPITNLTGRLGNQMFQYAYLYNQAKHGDIDDIYLQDDFWFYESLDDILALYRQGIEKKTDMVAIHVRRAKNPDLPSEPAYSDNPFYVDLCKREITYNSFDEPTEAKNYYDMAMEMFPKGTKFLVFSDDIEFCKDYFKGEQFEFYHGSEIEDMNMMASCVGHIIANSSFSWWGAYISPYTQKVVAPSSENWYTDGKERTKCPVAWIRI